MAGNTDITLRNRVIYSVFVRNHTAEGTFAALEKDLDRIRALGTDILWLLPIHPIGEKNRKGALGSPYAIADYRAVNPEYGDMEDFRRLVYEINRRGMKCIMDVVYNHTAPDSVLAQEHPEWFYRTPEGSIQSCEATLNGNREQNERFTMCNRTTEWTDVVDLDYENRALWDYQIETLVSWARIVDGFRCDVASLVPVDFWLRAREAVEAVRPGAIWLAETVEPGFITENRSKGFTAHSDCEVYAAFDLCYDYDNRLCFLSCVRGDFPLSRYVEMLSAQEVIYPANYVKLRFLENHDQPRAFSLFPQERTLRNWTAFCYLLRGAMLVYGGQEVACARTPSLFERDPLEWETGRDITGLLRKLYEIKQDPLLASGQWELAADDSQGLVTVRYREDDRGLLGRGLLGLFHLDGADCKAATGLPDGEYRNLLGGTVRVKNGGLESGGEPVVLTFFKFEGMENNEQK